MASLYTLAVYLLAPQYCAALLWRGVRERAYRRGFAQRLGFGAALPPGTVWLHAASAGEVQAAVPLLQALQRRLPHSAFLVTTTTPAGAQRARALFAGAAVEVRFVPLDLPGAVRRFLDRARPRLAVVMETEIWPNLYRACARRAVPLVLASARVSSASARRYARAGALMRSALGGVALAAAQTPADAERLVGLGAPAARTQVTGNIKSDFELPAEVVPAGARLRRCLGADRPVWVAGSTHEGEEAAVLAAHRQLRGTHPGALLVLAPRHPARFEAVAAWLARERVAFARHSRGGACDAGTEVLLVDALGELLTCYAAADLAFVGGSLVEVGGHNLLEPAALARPILTGPHNFNGADTARALVAAGAALTVGDAAELGREAGALLGDQAARQRMGAAGAAFVAANRGALQRLLDLMEPLLR